MKRRSRRQDGSGKRLNSARRETRAKEAQSGSGQKLASGIEVLSRCCRPENDVGVEGYCRSTAQSEMGGWSNWGLLRGEAAGEQEEGQSTGTVTQDPQVCGDQVSEGLCHRKRRKDGDRRRLGRKRAGE